MDRKPFTTREIAKFCHVTDRCVLIWIEEGKLKSYKTPGGHNRIKKENFLRFLKVHNMPIPEEVKGSIQSKKILIVDDDRNMVSAIRRILVLTKKYEVAAAYDGFEAGRKLLEFCPDLVLLDIRMPGIDGYEVARSIKQILKGEDIKIIAVSAYFGKEGKEKILSIGADACLDKPFSNENLLQEIERVI